LVSALAPAIVSGRSEGVAHSGTDRAGLAILAENTWCMRRRQSRGQCTILREHLVRAANVVPWVNLTAVTGGIIKAESMVKATGDSNASVFSGSLHRRPSAPSSIGVPTE
jgi:hypothetical protein